MLRIHGPLRAAGRRWGPSPACHVKVGGLAHVGDVDDPVRLLIVDALLHCRQWAVAVGFAVVVALVGWGRRDEAGRRMRAKLDSKASDVGGEHGKHSKPCLQEAT